VFAAAVIVFMAGGWLLDRWLHVMPVFTVIGALVGAALATFNIYMRLTEGGGGKGDRGR
jgi:F0F1-type ATP synthase assembly protein I